MKKEMFLLNHKKYFPATNFTGLCNHFPQGKGWRLHHLSNFRLEQTLENTLERTIGMVLQGIAKICPQMMLGVLLHFCFN